MRILFIGDITGSSGRNILKEHLPSLKEEYAVDLTIVNVDNAAHGLGVSPKIARSLRELGVDVMTGGNHLFDRKEVVPDLDDMPWLLRGANYSGEVPGAYVYIDECNGIPFLVTHLIGRTFMGTYENPFTQYDKVIEEHGKDIAVRIVDFHGEATSEKLAFARYVDGRASAVIGTHTHVQTADEQILQYGTAFITDVGMTGPHDGIIGMQTETVLPRFLTGLPTKFEPATGNVQLHAVVIEIDVESGIAKSIERIVRR